MVVDTSVAARPAWLLPAAMVGAFALVAATVATVVTGDDSDSVTTMAPGIVTVAPAGDQPVVPPVGPGGGDVSGGGAVGAEALVGVWQGQTVDSVGNPAVIQVSMMPNGTYTQTVESIASRDYLSGNWIVVDVSTIRFTILDYYPTEFCGPLGCTPIRPMPGFTINFRFLTPNRIEVREAGGSMTSVLDRLG